MAQSPEADFAEVATEYCRLIEGYRSQDPMEFLRRMSVVLPRLYAAGVGLPADPPSEGPDLPGMPHEKWWALFAGLVQHLGATGPYGSLFNPDEKSEPDAGCLADDLADIYRDLRPGLTAFSSGDPATRDSAVWAWVFGLTSHWGQHATGAIQALHQLRSGRRLP